MTIRQGSEFLLSLHSTTVIAPDGLTIQMSIGPADVESSRTATDPGGIPGIRVGSDAKRSCKCDSFE